MTKKEMADAHVSRMEKLHDPIALANMPAIIMTDSFCAGFDAGFAESQAGNMCGYCHQKMEEAGPHGYSPCDEIKALQSKLKLAVEALETLKVAVNDKVDDPGATNFIARTLEKIGETHE